MTKRTFFDDIPEVTLSQCKVQVKEWLRRAERTLPSQVSKRERSLIQARHEYACLMRIYGLLKEIHQRDLFL